MYTNTQYYSSLDTTPYDLHTRMLQHFIVLMIRCEWINIILSHEIFRLINATFLNLYKNEYNMIKLVQIIARATDIRTTRICCITRTTDIRKNHKDMLYHTSNRHKNHKDMLYHTRNRHKNHKDMLYHTSNRHKNHKDMPVARVIQA